MTIRCSAGAVVMIIMPTRSCRMCVCAHVVPGPGTLRCDIISNSKNTNTHVKKCGHKYKKILKAVQIIHACMYIHTMHTVQFHTHVVQVVNCKNVTKNKKKKILNTNTNTVPLYPLDGTRT